MMMKARLFHAIIVWSVASYLSVFFHSKNARMEFANPKADGTTPPVNNNTNNTENPLLQGRSAAATPGGTTRVTNRRPPKKKIISWKDDPIVSELVWNASAKYIKTNDKEISIFDGLGFGAVLEMEDPIGGRDFDCLEWYFDAWTKRVSVVTQLPLIESFFEWLDYGEGMDLEIKKDEGCGKEEFNERRYAKFSNTERRDSEVKFVFDANRTKTYLRDASDGSPVERGDWNFVWGKDHKVYVVEEEPDGPDNVGLGHATIFCGRPILFAGEFHVTGKHGRLQWVNEQSGHYKPKVEHMRTFMLWLQDEMGMNLDSVKWNYDERYVPASALIQ